MDWLPIETAPTDGTVVDLYVTFGNRGNKHTNCHFDDGQWYEWSCFDQMYIDVLSDYNNAEVTHWMPRPESSPGDKPA
jgi:hypothetical protein